MRKHTFQVCCMSVRIEREKQPDTGAGTCGTGLVLTELGGQHDRNLHLSLSPRDIERDLVPDATDSQISASFTELKVT